MSEKRRDNKNRVLRNGESQRKDGRYMYKYVDNAGNVKYVYSWKLVKTDTVPQGAKDDIPLRDKEKQIRKDLEDDIVSSGGDMTVLELVKKYISQKTGVRHNTEANYKFVINIIAKEAFGKKRIDKVKLSDAKGWLIKLQADGRGYSKKQRETVVFYKRNLDSNIECCTIVLTEPTTPLIFHAQPGGTFLLMGYFMYQYPKQSLTIEQQIFDKILSLSKGILISKQARDRLLSKLMSGELEVLE